MKNTFKRAISILLVAVMLFGTSPLAGLVGLDLPELDFLRTEAEAAEEATSGECGENLMWSLDLDTGVLTISGAGAMWDWRNDIGAPWFSHKSAIKSATISDGVTSIGDCAFFYCDSLESVTISDSVTSIGYYAFDDCHGLTSVTIGNGVKSIGDSAFAYCNSLASITIPDSVTSIGDYAFDDCNSLENVTIGNGVTSIGDSAFYGCASLASITVNSANTAYSSDEYGVLFNKNKTVLVKYPEGNARNSYTIPDSVTSIVDNAFYSCDSLSSITVDSANTAYSSDEYGVLSNRNKTVLVRYPEKNTIKSYAIPDSVTSIDKYAFSYCTNLASVTIGNSLTRIGGFAFYSCGSLKSIVIGNSVTRIEDCAFVFCSGLESVTIPNSVKSIEDCAFDFCADLKDVYYGGSKSDWKKIRMSRKNEYLTSANIHYGICDSEETQVPDNTPSYDASVIDAALVAEPSQAKISYGDSIVLHVDSAKIPEGGKVQWYLSNGNFSHTISSDGTTCTITPAKSGDTTVTAIVCDAEGNVVSADKQAMTSQAGFIDKIIAFFKKLFGLTKVYDQ